MNEMLEQCRALMETMMSGGGSWMGGMMPMSGGMMLIDRVWLAVLVATIVLLTWLLLRGREPRTDTDARHVLDIRYVSGELDPETYLRMRADLTDHAPAAR